MGYFYKKDGELFFKVKVVALPNGETLDENNRENDYGWIWHDTPPIEYLEWKEKQEEND